MIVTIDGPAGSGKSTVARQLAERLEFGFLDTGAMYRAIALKMLNCNCPLDDEEQIGRITRETLIRFEESRVLLDGDDVTDRIRSAEVTDAASLVAILPAVRAQMVTLQRKAVEGLNVVTEGRDQGTIVFPDAECKFFLTADDEVRALRRLQEHRGEGEPITLQQMLELIRQRDERDRNRAVAPLRPADDALEIDTSDMLIDQVVDVLETRVRETGS